MGTIREKIGVASWVDVQAALDQFDAQFCSHSQNTYRGQRDKVAEEDVLNFASSLKLIRVPDLTVKVQDEDGYQDSPGKKKVRGQFAFHNERYLLSISDAELEDDYLRRGNGQYAIGDAILCISLGEIYHGFSFRLIASVITQQRCEAANA